MLRNKINKIDGYNFDELLQIKSLSDIDKKLKNQKIPLINKNSLHLSATQFRNYMECSKKYKFNYVLKVPQTSHTFLQRPLYSLFLDYKSFL